MSTNCLICSKGLEELESKSSSKLSPKYSRSLRRLLNPAVAHAEDKAINDRQIQMFPDRGILIGGYDPIVMSNEVFLRDYQSKNLIWKDEAAQIKKVSVES